MILTVVQIDRAVLSGVAGQTFASVIAEVVDALRSVLARIVALGAERNLRFAVFPGESRQAAALVGLDSVVAGRVVLALVVEAVVDVDLATNAGVTGRANAVEPAFFQNFACSGVAARVAVASVDHVLAVLSVVSRQTPEVESDLSS